MHKKIAVRNAGCWEACENDLPHVFSVTNL